MSGLLTLDMGILKAFIFTSDFQSLFQQTPTKWSLVNSSTDIRMCGFVENHVVFHYELAMYFIGALVLGCTKGLQDYTVHWVSKLFLPGCKANMQQGIPKFQLFFLTFLFLNGSNLENCFPCPQFLLAVCIFSSPPPPPPMAGNFSYKYLSIDVLYHSYGCKHAKIPNQFSRKCGDHVYKHYQAHDHLL